MVAYKEDLMKLFAVLVCWLMFAGTAQAQSVGEKTGVNSMVGVAPKSADFVKLVAISDMFEIESSRMAEQRADAASKRFAERMIKDHTATSTELKGIAAKVRLDVPTAMDNAHQNKLDKLKGLQSVDFDKEYDSMQVDAHRDAVDLFERYSKGGDNKDLQAFAAKHLPHLREHLKMAQELTTTASKK
jgi:putative membrane protein